jgi:hypothetical protein
MHFPVLQQEADRAVIFISITLGMEQDFQQIGQLQVAPLQTKR